MNFLSGIDKKKEEVQLQRKQEEIKRKQDEINNALQKQDDRKEVGSFITKTKNIQDGAIFIMGNWFDNCYKPTPVKFEVRGDGDAAEENKDLEEDKQGSIEPNNVVGARVLKFIAGKQFMLILYDNGQLYSWGVSSKGCLGLGKRRLQTESKIERIRIHENVQDIQIGANHVLALCPSGKVYAWGDNTFGQVGFQNRFGKKSKSSKSSSNKAFYSPVLVYNPTENDDPLNGKNKAKQIVAYNDTSFMLNIGEHPTEIYGWGRNENNLLSSK